MANFRSGKKKNRIGKIVINSLIAASLVVVLGGPIRELYSSILQNVSSFHTNFSGNTNSFFQNYFNSVKFSEGQSRQIQAYSKKLESCEYQLNISDRIAQRVQTADALLKIKREYFPQSVAARIIARSPSSWHQELIIDKGSLDKLQPGMVCITEKGVLGQIQEVRSHHSIVQLMSSSQIRFGALLPRSNIIGILFGDRNGYAQLKFVPIGSDVKKGDIIQTTGINPNGMERLFPVSYPVGKVIEVSKDDSNSEMFIRAKLFEDGSTMSDVLVLLPGGNKVAHDYKFEHLAPVSTEASSKAPVVSEIATIPEKEVPPISKPPIRKPIQKPVSTPTTAAEVVETKPQIPNQ